MSSAPPEAPIDPVARQSRRRLVWIFGVLLALVAGVFGVIIYSDAEAPDVSDLAFTPIKVADEQNLYLQLAAAGKRFSANPIIQETELDDLAPVESNSFGQPYLKQRLLQGEGWTPDRLAKLAPELDQVVIEWTKLKALPLAQGSIPDKLYDSGSYSDVLYFCDHLRLAASARAREGRLDEALALSISGLHLGRKIRDSRGAVLDYIGGNRVLCQFQQQLHALASRPDISPAQLLRIVETTREPDPLPDGYEHALRNQFRVTRLFLENHTATEASAPYFSQPLARLLAKTRVLFPLVYKPRLTLTLHADATREELAYARDTNPFSPAARAATASLRPVGGCSHCAGITDAAELLRPINAHGREVLFNLSPNQPGIRRLRLEPHTRRSLLQAYLALRLHHLATGTLPATLDELVPSLLPAVPLDYADGAPIRYSREARTIWSVGHNPAKPLLVTSADQTIYYNELFHRLDFAAPAAP